VLYANASFVAGTNPETVDDFVGEMQRALSEAEEALGGDLILHAVCQPRHNSGCQTHDS